MRTVSMVITAVALLVGLYLGGQASVLDLPSVIFIIFTGFALLLMSCSVREIGAALAYPAKHQPTDDESSAASKVSLIAIRSLLYAGVMGVLIAGVQMLQNLGDLSGLPLQIAVSMIPALYAFVVAVALFLPIYFLAASQLPNPESPAEPKADTPGMQQWLIGMVIVLGLFFAIINSGGGELNVWIDIPSLLIVVGGMVGVVLLSQTLQEGVQRDALLNMALFFLMICGQFAGLIRMLSYVNQPGEVGPGMALVLLSSLYALLAASLFTMPWGDRLKSTEQPRRVEQLNLSVYLIPSMAFLGWALSFAFLFWAMAGSS